MGIIYICSHLKQLNIHELFMHRCLQLAQLGRGFVAPNPMVGAVLVYNNRIIGEGFHHQYGGPHAEVNCINSVKESDKHLIPDSVMYVSLEPCSHFGKTPPCADLIIANRIPEVVIGCRDPFSNVDGRGIGKLQANGVKVHLGVLEKECVNINNRFFIFHTRHRPFVILKWAQTANGKIGSATNQRLMITNKYSNRLVHRWRSEESSILVGTNTALMDDPQLSNRLWSGPSPASLVLDMDLRLPATLKLFNHQATTIVFNKHKHDLAEGWTLPSAGEVITGYYQLTEDVSTVQQVIHALYQLGVQSVLVEGGARLLQSFIDEETWDEARIITNDDLLQEAGLPAPVLHHALLLKEEKLFTDNIRYYLPANHSAI